MIKSIVRTTTLAALSGALLFPLALRAQFPTAVSQEAGGDIFLKWASKKGAIYQVERSSGLEFGEWEDIGFEIYGQTDSDPADESTFAALKIYTAPVPPAGGGNPQAPPAEPSFTFFIVRDDGDTLVS